jgi:hypothetical protein
MSSIIIWLFSQQFLSKPNITSPFEKSRQTVSASSMKTQLSLLQWSKTKIVQGKCDHKDFITNICLTWKNVSVGNVFNK